MGRQKILFLHVGLGRGGAEHLRHMLLKNIDKSRYDIKLCCIGDKGEIGRKIEQLGFRVDELGLPYSFKNIKTTMSVAGYFRKEKPDILQTSLFDANFHGRVAALFAGIRNVITEEHSDHYQYRTIKYLPHILSDFALARLKTRFIVCCSETLRKDIIKKEMLPAKKVVTIKNCIDPDMHKIRESRESVRQRFGIKDEMVLITVASLSNRKGHEYLLDALKILKEKGYRFRHFLAGDGPLKDLIYKKCEDYGLLQDVIFLGNVDNVADYLNASDIFVLPSIFEGLPLVLIEAMFAGLPCVVTDVGANRELITDGINGIIVPPADKNELAKAVSFYFENRDKIKQFGDNGRKVVHENCLVGAYAKQFSKLWDSLA